jgi:hypothetical protein
MLTIGLVTLTRLFCMHGYWSLSMPSECSFLYVCISHATWFGCLSRSCLLVASDQPGGSETLAVRRAVVRHNFVANVAAAFVPAWLTRVSGAVF